MRVGRRWQRKKQVYGAVGVIERVAWRLLVRYRKIGNGDNLSSGLGGAVGGSFWRL